NDEAEGQTNIIHQDPEDIYFTDTNYENSDYEDLADDFDEIEDSESGNSRINYNIDETQCSTRQYKLTTEQVTLREQNNERDDIKYFINNHKKNRGRHKQDCFCLLKCVNCEDDYLPIIECFQECQRIHSVKNRNGSD